ncbi:MAG: peptidyl-prolyl cis-trans isomerase, partial [Candidatus Tectomicrobia bacterium]|nr:peptidyl-prolyl cis-trans isomerase [Candidatus Tectomicrobia bacterium]
EGEGDVRPLARAIGEPITVGDFLHRYAQDLMHLRSSKASPAEKNRVILEKAILAVLEGQAALKKDYYTNSPQLQLLARRRLERVLYEAFYRKVVVGGVSRLPEQVEGFYQRHVDRYSAPDRVRLHGILLREREQAEGVLQELQKGADFQHLVDRVSLDPPSYIGDWVGLDTLPHGLGAAVAELAVGKVSGIVSADGGFLIVQVVEREKGKPLPFAGVKERVEGHYLREQGGEVLRDWGRRLRQASEVRVRQGLLGRIQGEEFTPASR